MLLAIDIGNTNAVFAVFDSDRLAGQWRMATLAHRTSDEYAVWLTQVMQGAGLSLEKIDGVILATVVPETQFSIIRLARDYCKVEPLIVGDPNVNLGVDVLVDKPEEVGADRLVNAIEAWRRYRQAMIVIDFGTATTFDIVNGKGQYIGGVIAPGVNLSLEALHHAAAKLPSIRVRVPEKVIGKSTVTAMESGIYFGYIGLIEGIAARIKEEYGAETPLSPLGERVRVRGKELAMKSKAGFPPPNLPPQAGGGGLKMKTIATGGLAPLYARSCPTIEETVEDLTIYGLHTIYQRNKK